MPNSLLQMPLIFSRFVLSQMLTTSSTSFILNVSSVLRKPFPTIPLCSRVSREKVHSGCVFRTAGRPCGDTSVTSGCLHAAAGRLLAPPRPSSPLRLTAAHLHRLQVLVTFMAVEFMLRFKLPLISRHQYLTNCSWTCLIIQDFAFCHYEYSSQG